VAPIVDGAREAARRFATSLPPPAGDASCRPSPNMGSEKKRKRRDSEAAEGEGGDAAPLSEKKKAKKAAKKAARAAAQDAPASPAAAPAVPPAEPGQAATTDERSGLADVPPLVSPIASPMADRKLAKRAHKLVEAAAKAKALRRGIKEVVLALRKGDKGVCFIAGDVFPVEVIAHLPLLCEEADVPYCYVARKSELGAAALTKRPTSVVLVSSKGADAKLADDIRDCRREVAVVQTVF
jgi:H/ACA ribonucleoprotein complex subunit 2